MTYEKRMAKMVDRLITELLFDPAIDLDTKRKLFELRDEAHEIIKLVEEKENAAKPGRDPLPHAGNQIGHAAQPGAEGVL